MADTFRINADQFTLSEQMIKTRDGIHELYVQEWGHSEGVPFYFYTEVLVADVVTRTRLILIQPFTG